MKSFTDTLIEEYSEVANWSVCIDPDGDSDWSEFDSEFDAKSYFDSLVADVKADPDNFGEDYTVQLWHGDELVTQFSTNPNYNELTN